MLGSFRFVVAPVLVGVVLLVGGCSVPVGVEKVAPVVSADPVVPVIELGDVALGDVVEDEFGSYAQTTINPESDAFSKLAVVDPALHSGFSEGELLDAQRWVAKFVAEEALDSIALDGDSGWAAWMAADDFTGGPVAASLYTVVEGSNSDRSLIIFNNPNNHITHFVRDGGPRVEHSSIDISKLNNVAFEGNNYVQVVGKAVNSYRMDESEAVLFAQSANGEGFTVEEIETKFPMLADGEVESFVITWDFRYALVKESSGWSVAGYYTTFTSNIKDLLG